MVKKCPPGVFSFDKMTLILLIFILIIVLIILNINNKIGKIKKLSSNNTFSKTPSKMLETSQSSETSLNLNDIMSNNLMSDDNIDDDSDNNNVSIENIKIIKKPKDKIIIIENDNEYAFNNNSTKDMDRNLINLNNRPRVDNQNKLSYWGYVNQHNGNRIMNPQLPPERSFEQTYRVPVNIPTRGYDGGYQQIGMLYKESVSSEDSVVGNNSESVILPLYGKPVHPGSNKWSYYTSSDKFQTVKIPLSHKGRKCDSQYGCTELYDDDIISVPPYNNNFKVKLYEYDKPRYIPYVY